MKLETWNSEFSLPFLIPVSYQLTQLHNYVFGTQKEEVYIAPQSVSFKNSANSLNNFFYGEISKLLGNVVHSCTLKG